MLEHWGLETQNCIGFSTLEGINAQMFNMQYETNKFMRMQVPRYYV